MLLCPFAKWFLTGWQGEVGCHGMAMIPPAPPGCPQSDTSPQGHPQPTECCSQCYQCCLSGKVICLYIRLYSIMSLSSANAKQGMLCFPGQWPHSSNAPHSAPHTEHAGGHADPWHTVRAGCGGAVPKAHERCGYRPHSSVSLQVFTLWQHRTSSSSMAQCWVLLCGDS